MTVVGSAARPTARASNTDAGGVLLISASAASIALRRLGEERGAIRARRILFRRKRRLLRCVERRAARVGQQTVRRSGQVHQVKADRRGAVRRQPYLVVDQPFRPALGILEGLQEGVGRRHQHGTRPPRIGPRSQNSGWTDIAWILYRPIPFPLRPLQL